MKINRRSPANKAFGDRFFTGVVTALATNQALALNQDGTRNSFSNPARGGSIMSLYTTGSGQTAPPGVSGKPAQAPYAQDVLPISVLIDGASAEVSNAAEAPGYVGLYHRLGRVSQGSRDQLEKINIGPISVKIESTISSTGTRSGVCTHSRAAP